LAKKKPARKRVSSPFAKNLGRVLSERGISQRAAAELAQVQPSVLSGWLTGSQANDPIAIQRLARGLGCSFEWLLTGSDSQLEVGKISMAELFDGEPDPSFSGIFEISARRLRRKKQG
jgi:transcriptional regulator with XRE-family HTH domain